MNGAEIILNLVLITFVINQKKFTIISYKSSYVSETQSMYLHPRSRAPGRVFFLFGARNYKQLVAAEAHYSRTRNWGDPAFPESSDNSNIYFVRILQPPQRFNEAVTLTVTINIKSPRPKSVNQISSHEKKKRKRKKRIASFS